MERQGRIAELISLLDYAISIGNDDLAQEVRSDIFRETKGTLQMNEGGMMNIDDMIRPIGMASGGDANRAELEGLLKSLNISLMLAQETGSFLGGGNAEKIKELENQIRQIELELLK